MIHDLLLRWEVTALFLVSAAEFGRAAVTQRRSWSCAVGHGLHFVMAIAMTAMAWPLRPGVPNGAGAVFFLVAAVWFVAMAFITAKTASDRAHDAYHAAMMLAMSWMYVVMDGRLLPGRSHDTAPPEPMPNMPGMDMDMPGMQMPAAQTSTGPAEWVTAVNWFWMVGFALAAAWWVYRYVTARRNGDRQGSFDIACQAMMAVGTAVMFGALL